MGVMTVCSIRVEAIEIKSIEWSSPFKSMKSILGDLILWHGPFSATHLLYLDFNLQPVYFSWKRSLSGHVSSTPPIEYLKT